MRTDAYTPDAICRCLGLPGYEADSTLTTARESVRLLLTPSFDPEVCITFTDRCVSVIAAQSMIWHQAAPMPVRTDRDQNEISADAFAALVSALTEATLSAARGTVAVIDGMPVHALLIRQGTLTSRFEHNVGRPSPFSAVVADAISASWHCVTNVYCRNALATAAKYAGLKLALLPEPKRKPTVQTLVLGADQERMQLIEAIKKLRDG